MNNIFKKIVTLVVFTCFTTVAICKDKNPPNVVLIFMDDLGYGDLGSYGALDYQTPNLDKLAANGMRFTNFLAAQAVCSASRAGILTGCYPNRIGITGALFPNSKIGLNQEEQTIPELLKNKNYATGMFGKWHLGDSKEFLPLQHGFDEFVGIPYSNDMWPVWYDGKPATKEQVNKYRFVPLPLIEGNEKISEIKTLEDQSHLTRLFTEKSVDFIRRKKNSQFFLYLAHPMPHVPIAASEGFKGKSKQGEFGDVLMEIDWSIGEIMKALHENGLEENTLVIFTSDNGPWLNFGNQAGSAGGFREGKGSSFEGGMRVPCIMSWKNTIPSGTICNQLASSIDLLPTIANICKVKMSGNQIDGVNITSLLKGDATVTPRKYFYYYYNRNELQGVRRDNWKLVFPHKGRSYLSQQPGKDGFPGNAPENAPFTFALYDLRRDPSEAYDVKDSFPEIVEELKLIAEKAREDLGDDLQNKTGNNKRKAGIQVTNP